AARRSGRVRAAGGARGSPRQRRARRSRRPTKAARSTACHRRARERGGRRSPSRPSVDVKELASDDDPLDLAGAFADLHETDVAQVAFDRKVLEVSISAEYLKRRVGGTRRGLRRIELGLRRRVGEPQARVGEGRGAVNEKASRVELGAGPREAPLDHLEFGDRSAELPALLRVPDRDVERRPAKANGERTDPDAPPGEHAFHVSEGVPVAADTVRCRDAAIVEHELRGIRRVKAHLLLAAAEPKAVGPAWDAER